MLKHFETLQSALILLAADHLSVNLSLNDNDWTIIKVRILNLALAQAELGLK